jgi:Tfp pilus assembly protein PilO
VIERGSNLTRLRVSMELAGTYADIRDFIHEIEASPEFVVIDDVNVSGGIRGADSLGLSLQLSTYFRTTEP